GAGAGSAYACSQRWRIGRRSWATARCTWTRTRPCWRRSRCTSVPATGGSSGTTTIPTRRRGSPSASTGDADLERLRAGAHAGQDLARLLDPMTLRALEDRVDDGPAVAVLELHRRALGPGEVAVAPIGDGDQHGIQVEALLGQPVLVPSP